MNNLIPTRLDDVEKQNTIRMLIITILTIVIGTYVLSYRYERYYGNPCGLNWAFTTIETETYDDEIVIRSGITSEQQITYDLDGKYVNGFCDLFQCDQTSLSSECLQFIRGLEE